MKVASIFNQNSGPTFQEKKDEIMSQIDKYDETMLSYLARLYEAINGEKMDFTKIKNAVDALAAFNKKSEYNYLNNLMYPEKCKGVKIPSPIPVPSCSFQLHNCVTLTTNASGNLAFIFNPFFLANQQKLTYADPPESNTWECTGVNYLSTLWINNDDSLTGYEQNGQWAPVNIGQVIPNVYDQYRLVSASIVVKYIGRLDITSGVIGGAIIYDDNKAVGANINLRHTIDPFETRTSITRNDNLTKYGNFDLAMDSFYHQENLVLEGIRELYFPLDNSYEEYTQLADLNKSEYVGIRNNASAEIRFPDADVYKSGFNYFVYVLGAPASSACFKVDIYCNFECLPNASFLNYLPLSMNAESITNVEKKNAIAMIQQKPVMNLKDSAAMIVSKPSIWEKLKNKFSNSLPGITKLMSWGLGTMIPSLKPGLALAGTMINAVNNQQNQPIEEEVE